MTLSTRTCTRSTRTALTFLLACVCSSHLSAVEVQLQQGPEVLYGRYGIQTGHSDKGLYRSDGLVATGVAQGRWDNIGLNIEAWMAIEGDDTNNVDSFDLTGVNLRIDYLFEEQDFFQLIPHLQFDTYPNLPSSVDNPTWLGADFWYMLPWEGCEVGCSLDADISGEQGVYASIAARQMFQNSPYDLLTWQTLNLGDKKFHTAYSGDDSAGITTIDLGAELTLPLAWEKTWIVLNTEYNYWLMNSDRDAGDNSSTFVIGVSFLYRER